MGCVSTETLLYGQLASEAEIVKNFDHEIEYAPAILAYFQGIDIGRFVQQFSEQLCDITGGTCSYRGDSMSNILKGMQISEKGSASADFFVSKARNSDSYITRPKGDTAGTFAIDEYHRYKARVGYRIRAYGVSEDNIPESSHSDNIHGPFVGFQVVF